MRSVSVQMKMPRDLGSSVMTRWVQADSGSAGVVVPSGPLGTEETAETTVPRERDMARGGAKRARVAVEVIERARASETCEEARTANIFDTRGSFRGTQRGARADGPMPLVAMFSRA